MAPIDWVIAAVLALSLLGAAKNGFLIEAFSLAGVVLGLLIASWNYQRLIPWLGRFIHTPAVTEAIAFLAIAFGVMIVAGLIGHGLRWSARSIGLGWMDRIAGAAFGLLKGCVIVTLGVMALAAFWPRTNWLDGSRFAPYFLSAAHSTTIVTPEEFGGKIREGVRMIRDASPDWLKPHASRSRYLHGLAVG